MKDTHAGEDAVVGVLLLLLLPSPLLSLPLMMMKMMATESFVNYDGPRAMVQCAVVPSDSEDVSNLE